MYRKNKLPRASQVQAATRRAEQEEADNLRQSINIATRKLGEGKAAALLTTHGLYRICVDDGTSKSRSDQLDNLRRIDRVLGEEARQQDKSQHYHRQRKHK